MKSTIEKLSPTRVKLTVDVPFDELGPAIDGAYKRLARAVKVQGFRPGKVPPRILDQRVGRATVIQEALETAVPDFYSAAAQEQTLAVVGRPSLEVESVGDGAPLVFTATVDVRPDIILPPYDGIAVTVDDAVVAEQQVDEQVARLRDRFASLDGVERPAQTGDYVLIDIRGTLDGALLEGSEASGLSYEVGSEQLVPGLDEALVGLNVGDQKAFDAPVRWGEHSGQTATFDATVRAVKTKQLPPLDDAFAAMASEYDTLAELRADISDRLARIARLEQAVQARNRTLDALLSTLELPLPESMVDGEVEWRRHDLNHQVEQAGMTYEQFLADAESTADEVDTKIRQESENAVKTQLVLDAIARAEELQVSEPELADQLVRRAQRAGVPVDQFANALVENRQLPVLMGELLRGKALAHVLEQAAVTDASGNTIDLGSLREDLGAPGA